MKKIIHGTCEEKIRENPTGFNCCECVPHKCRTERLNKISTVIQRHEVNKFRRDDE